LWRERGRLVCRPGLSFGFLKTVCQISNSLTLNLLILTSFWKKLALFPFSMIWVFWKFLTDNFGLFNFFVVSGNPGVVIIRRQSAKEFKLCFGPHAEFEWKSLKRKKWINKTVQIEMFYFEEKYFLFNLDYFVVQKYSVLAVVYN